MGGYGAFGVGLSPLLHAFFFLHLFFFVFFIVPLWYENGFIGNIDRLSYIVAVRINVDIFVWLFFLFFFGIQGVHMLFADVDFVFSQYEQGSVLKTFKLKNYLGIIICSFSLKIILSIAAIQGSR